MALSFNPHRLRVVSDKENSARSIQFASTLGTIREAQHTPDSALGSSKLNASSASTLGGARPRLAGLGIGKAPSASRGGGKKFKPYPRVNSIQRAKDRLNKGTSLPLAERIVDGLSQLSSKPASTSAQAYGGESRRWIKVPLRLPMPVFPLVQLDEACFPDLAGVPLEYVTDSLRPLLKLFYVHAKLYTPALHLSPFPRPIQMIDAAEKPVTRWTAPEMALAIAPAARRDPSFDDLKAKVEGYAPDIVLAVHKAAQSAEGSKADGAAYEQPHMVPVNELVLASQCAYWSSLTAWETHTPVPYIYYSSGDKSNSAAGALGHSRAVSNPHPFSQPHPAPKRLPTPDLSSYDPSTSALSEVEAEADAESSQNRRSRSVSFPPTPPASIRLNSPEPRSAAGDGDTLTLPVIPIFLPDPSNFTTTLLPLLHLPSRSALSTLLGLPPAQCASRESIVAHLAELELGELAGRLKGVHATWRNACAVGDGVGVFGGCDGWEGLAGGDGGGLGVGDGVGWRLLQKRKRSYSHWQIAR